VSTNFFDCCDAGSGSWLFFQKVCPSKSMEAAVAVENKSAVYVGSFCKKKWPLVGCVQRAKSYCVFNGELARIIQECARPQLEAFQPNGDWGSAEHPNCRGFTPEEFQVLDLSECDLSPVFSDVIPDMPIQQIQEKMLQGLQ
jgi:conjugal transfer mating pair stabilization protein TraN